MGRMRWGERGTEGRDPPEAKKPWKFTDDLAVCFTNADTIIRSMIKEKLDYVVEYHLRATKQLESRRKYDRDYRRKRKNETEVLVETGTAVESEHIAPSVPEPQVVPEPEPIPEPEIIQLPIKVESESPPKEVEYCGCKVKQRACRRCRLCGKARLQKTISLNRSEVCRKVALARWEKVRLSKLPKPEPVPELVVPPEPIPAQPQPKVEPKGKIIPLRRGKGIRSVITTRVFTKEEIEELNKTDPTLSSLRWHLEQKKGIVNGKEETNREADRLHASRP